MTARFNIFAIACALLAVAVCGFFWYQREKDAAQTLFLSESLKNAVTNEEVIVGDIPYAVVNGAVSVSDSAKKQQLEALRLAYAKVLVRRSPILAIPGVDPENLRTEVHRLSEVTAKMVSESAPSDAPLIRVLYPVNFLYSLATLEEKRQVFLATGRQKDFDDYDQTLGQTLHEESEALANFTTAFSAATAGQESIRLVTLGGTMTKDSMTEALAALKNKVEELRRMRTVRASCLSGSLDACNMNSIALPILEKSGYASEGAALPKTAAEIRTLTAKLSRNPSVFSFPVVALSSSTCTSMLPGPYFFLLQEAGTEWKQIISLINELFLYRAADFPTAPIINFFARTYDSEVLPMYTTHFYVCPDILTDVSAVLALVAERDFAFSHPKLAPAERAVFTGLTAFVSQEKGLTYARAAIESAAKNFDDPSSLNTLLELLLSSKRRTAGLDRVVSQIAVVNEYDRQLKKGGVLFDFSARNMFLTHSAFASLFVTDGSSLAIKMQDESDNAKLRKQNLTLSEMEKIVPRTTIERDLETFFKAEWLKIKPPVQNQ